MRPSGVASPGAKKVLVMRGTGRWRNDSRRPLPVDANAVLAGADQVVEVRGERAVLEDRGALRGRALVVDAIRALGVRAAAVVVGGDAFVGELVAQSPGVDR